MNIYFMFLGGLMVFIFNYKYLLINLISIEFMMLSLFMFCYICLMVYNYEFTFLLFMLSFMVSEGVLGLSLLISMVRVLGNNYLYSLSLLKW